MPKYSEKTYSPQYALRNIGAAFWDEYSSALLAYAKDRPRADILAEIHTDWDARGNSPVGTDTRIEWALALYDHGD